MVMLISPSQIEAARSGKPVESLSPFSGTPFFSAATEHRVTRTCHCRCCGSLLNRNTTVLRVELFMRNTPDNVRTPVAVYLHKEDCLAEGFVQTLGFGDRSLDIVRYVQNGMVVEGFMARTVTNGNIQLTVTRVVDTVEALKQRQRLNPVNQRRFLEKQKLEPVTGG